MMRIAIVCNDTRGGIQPYVALGIGLRGAGHSVRIVAPKGFRSFVESAGLECSGLEVDVQEYMRGPEVAAAMEKGFWATHKLMIEKTGPMMCGVARDCLAGCEGIDLLIAGFGGMLVGESVAEKLGVPFVQAHVQPLASTGEYPGLLSIPGLRGIGVANRVSHAVSRQVFWQPVRRAVNEARKQVLGLPRIRFGGNVGIVRNPGGVCLYGYSPSLLPLPKNLGPGHHVTGYWFLDEPDWSPPTGLAEFIGSGPPPIAIGFGSMAGKDAATTARLLLEAARLAGRRVVLLSGWGGMHAEELPEWAYLTESAPHAWLFPRCALAVHHGGAGTTGAALRAGIPSVIVPFGADQPFWGWLIENKGLGACAGPRRKLTADKLAKAISETLSDEMILRQSAEMGRRVRAEDGVAAAVGLLENRKRDTQSNAHQPRRAG